MPGGEPWSSDDRVLLGAFGMRVCCWKYCSGDWMANEGPQGDTRRLPPELTVSASLSVLPGDLCGAGSGEASGVENPH
jgi:hypothetical protein